METSMLEHNQFFTTSNAYQIYQTGKIPRRRLAVVTCMDARLTGLLPAALGLLEGDAVFLRNAGGTISEPYGETVRGLLIAVHSLEVKQVLVIGHTDCGVEQLSGSDLLRQMGKTLSPEQLSRSKRENPALEQWLTGFDTPAQAVSESVTLLKNHPLLPDWLPIEGWVIDTATGVLTPCEPEQV